MPVATAGHLVTLKLLARDDETRPQDAADLRALHAVLGAADRAAARTAAELMPLDLKHCLIQSGMISR